mgnify:CR=1 FL=1
MPISSQVSDMLPHYHDTLMLLKKYRDIAWIVEVSSRNLQEEFRAEYGCPGRDVLNSLALNKTDASLMDCSQSLEHSAKMLHIIDSAVDLIREKHKNHYRCNGIKYNQRKINKSSDKHLISC